jgi:hypothetical protein
MCNRVGMGEDRAMGGVEILGVDERDSSWENSNPRFRVYLQRTQGSYVGGWTATYDVTGADLVQVIDWAQRTAGDALVYSIALVMDDQGKDRVNPGHGRGLVWLVGMDGNRSQLDPDEAEIQNRMLARRREPVVVPRADRMPFDVLNPYGDDTTSR